MESSYRIGRNKGGVWVPYITHGLRDTQQQIDKYEKAQARFYDGREIHSAPGRRVLMYNPWSYHHLSDEYRRWLKRNEEEIPTEIKPEDLSDFITEERRRKKEIKEKNEKVLEEVRTAQKMVEQKVVRLSIFNWFLEPKRTFDSLPPEIKEKAKENSDYEQALYTSMDIEEVKKTNLGLRIMETAIWGVIRVASAIVSTLTKPFQFLYTQIKNGIKRAFSGKPLPATEIRRMSQRVEIIFDITKVHKFNFEASTKADKFFSISNEQLLAFKKTSKEFNLAITEINASVFYNLLFFFNLQNFEYSMLLKHYCTSGRIISPAVPSNFEFNRAQNGFTGDIVDLYILAMTLNVMPIVFVETSQNNFVEYAFSKEDSLEPIPFENSRNYAILIYYMDDYWGTVEYAQIESYRINASYIFSGKRLQMNVNQFGDVCDIIATKVNQFVITKQGTISALGAKNFGSDKDILEHQMQIQKQKKNVDTANEVINSVYNSSYINRFSRQENSFILSIPDDAVSNARSTLINTLVDRYFKIDTRNLNLNVTKEGVYDSIDRIFDFIGLFFDCMICIILVDPNETRDTKVEGRFYNTGGSHIMYFRFHFKSKFNILIGFETEIIYPSDVHRNKLSSEFLENLKKKIENLDTNDAVVKDEIGLTLQRLMAWKSSSENFETYFRRNEDCMIKHKLENFSTENTNWLKNMIEEQDKLDLMYMFLGCNLLKPQTLRQLDITEGYMKAGISELDDLAGGVYFYEKLISYLGLDIVFVVQDATTKEYKAVQLERFYLFAPYRYLTVIEVTKDAYIHIVPKVAGMRNYFETTNGIWVRNAIVSKLQKLKKLGSVADPLELRAVQTAFIDNSELFYRRSSLDSKDTIEGVNLMMAEIADANGCDYTGFLDAELLRDEYYEAVFDCLILHESIAVFIKNAVSVRYANFELYEKSQKLRLGSTKLTKADIINFLIMCDIGVLEMTKNEDGESVTYLYAKKDFAKECKKTDYWPIVMINVEGTEKNKYRAYLPHFSTEIKESTLTKRDRPIPLFGYVVYNDSLFAAKKVKPMFEIVHERYFQKAYLINDNKTLK